MCAAPGQVNGTYYLAQIDPKQVSFEEMEWILYQAEMGLGPELVFLYVYGKDAFSVMHQTSFQALAQTFPSLTFLKYEDKSIWHLNSPYLTRGLPSLAVFEKGHQIGQFGRFISFTDLQAYVTRLTGLEPDPLRVFPPPTPYRSPHAHDPSFVYSLAFLVCYVIVYIFKEGFSSRARRKNTLLSRVLSLSLFKFSLLIGLIALSSSFFGFELKRT